jgi:hypothetical protein
VNPDFKSLDCNICWGLVYKPSISEECCSLSHKSCIKEWLKDKNTCPKCRKAEFVQREPTIFEKEYWDSVLI